jgi:hypothetical protein
MNERIPRKILDRLTEIVVSDFDLHQRRKGIHQFSDLDDVCSSIIELCNSLPIIYTAFDGDHFQLSGHMRTHALLQGCVPANPESILGYKDTVTARLEKAGVLRDDLSVLRRCDQLWVFTEEQPVPDALQNLAEGVVVELLYFLKRRPTSPVYFVSPLSRVCGEQPPLIQYNYSYSDSKQALHPEQREGVLDLANSGAKVDKELSPIAYHIYDSLDFKYAHWLRPRAYEDGCVPLVPGLAIHLRDLGGKSDTLAQILISWAKLCEIATYAWIIPSMDASRVPSAIVALLERVWLRTHGAETIRRRQWIEYPIPKARLGTKWPLTKKEGGLK